MAEGEPLSSAQIQSALIEVMSGQGGSTFVPSIGGIQHLEGLKSYVARKSPHAKPPDFYDVMEALWSLVGQGFVYLNFSQSAPSRWTFQLTAAGKAAANDQDFNPDSPEYLRRLQEKVPDASDTVLSYVTEALRSYLNRCYLASAVMLGVASEAAFLEMAEAFGRWLPSDEGTRFSEFLRNPRTSYHQKFQEYRKKLEPRKPFLPEDISDGMDLTLVAIADLLRIYRNEAGHPTGKQIGRDQAKINLEMFARCLERMYAFKVFFERSTI
jgi:hypothetical protein